MDRFIKKTIGQIYRFMYEHTDRYLLIDKKRFKTIINPFLLEKPKAKIFQVMICFGNFSTLSFMFMFNFLSITAQQKEENNYAYKVNNTNWITK